MLSEALRRRQIQYPAFLDCCSAIWQDAERISDGRKETDEGKYRLGIIG